MKNIRFVASLVMVAMLSAAGMAQAKGFTHLSFSGNYPEKHPTTRMVFKPFMKAAEEKFGGKLSFDYFAVNNLYPESEEFVAVTDGRADFAVMRPSLFPGKAGLIKVIDIPGMCPNAIVGSLVLHELVTEFPAVREQLPANSVPFTTWGSASWQINTVKPVTSPEEIKGKKIIAWTAPSLEFVKALGANPIRMSAPDTYMALSKGMADGVLCPIAPMRAFKINEVAKYHLMLNLGVASFTMNANKDLWDSLPQEMRDWLSAEGGMKMALAAGKSLEDGQKADIEWMEKQENKFYYLDEAQRKAMLIPFEKFAEKWKNEDCKGLDKELVEKVYKFVRERSAYYTEQVRSGKYGDYKI